MNDQVLREVRQLKRQFIMISFGLFALLASTLLVVLAVAKGTVAPIDPNGSIVMAIVSFVFLIVGYLLPALTLVFDPARQHLAIGGDA